MPQPLKIWNTWASFICQKVNFGGGTWPWTPVVQSSSLMLPFTDLSCISWSCLGADRLLSFWRFHQWDLSVPNDEMCMRNGNPKWNRIPKKSLKGDTAFLWWLQQFHLYILKTHMTITDLGSPVYIVPYQPINSSETPLNAVRGLWVPESKWRIIRTTAMRLTRAR